MNKIKIECTEKQKDQIIEMINCGDDRSCYTCPLKEECDNTYTYNYECSNVWNGEIDWVIK